MKRYLFPIVVLACATLLLFCAPLFSQEIRGSIEGIVTDQQGGAVPGATITVTNVATGVVRTTQTGDTGNYTVPFLPPGTYKVSAEAQGFAISVNPALVLRAQETKRSDFTLQLGTVVQEVTVTSQTPLLQTGSTSMQGSVSSSIMRDLPIRENAMAMALLMPGITNTNNFHGGALGGRLGGVSPAANGLRDTTAGYTIDGANMTDGLYSYSALVPVMDSIEEVTIQTSNASAEFGTTMGARINFAMKSGTNSFHGTAWEYVENDILNARNFFSPTVPPRRYNQFGGVVGGPIRKNKLFFFGMYEGIRSRFASNFQQTIPNEAQRSGDLSVDVNGNPVPIFNDPTTGQPFPLLNGKPNQIPANRISPTAAAAIDLLLPPTNAPGPFNLRGNISRPSVNNRYMFKIDYVVSDKDYLNGRFYSVRGNGLSFGNGNTACPHCTTLNENFAYNAGLIHTRTLSPTAVLASRVSWNRTPASGVYSQNPASFDTRALFGMTIPSSITSDDKMNAYPHFTITGFNPIGNLGNFPNFQWDENYEIASDLALVRGKHSIKLGVDLIRYRVGRFVNVATNGQLSFSNSNPNGSGYALADFLLGLPSASTLSDKPITADVRRENLSFFLADKWRVTPKLTIDWGLRYEFTTPPNEHWGRMSTFSATPPGQFNVLRPAEPLWSTTYRNWAPRVGFTYQLASKTLIRTAAGTFYSFPAQLFLVLKANNPPFIRSFNFSSAPGAPLTSENAFPIGQVAAGGVISPNPWSPYQKTPRVQSWNFTIQHSFSPNVVLDVGYAGNRAAHLINHRTLNRPPDPGLLCPISGPIPGCVPFGDIQSRRPLPNFTGYGLWDDFGFSTYHALQVKLEKRFSDGIMLLGTYTWSKAMDISSNEAINNTYFADKPADFYGPSDMDNPHRTNLTFLWQLPVGRGRHWAPSSRAADAIIGGWLLASTATYASGWPFSIGYSTSINNVGAPQLPLRVCNGKLSDRTIEKWYDPACFESAVPPDLRSTYSYGFQGNSGHGILRGPHFGQWNITLLKDFTTFENQYLQFRAEFYNAFNNVSFGLPASTVGPGITNAGRISSAAAGRAIRLGLKYYF